MYIDNNIYFPVLTLNILIHGQPIIVPEEQFNGDDEIITKRQRYIKCCKDAAWNRWNKECLLSLRGRNNMKNNQDHTEIAIGDVALIKGDGKRRDKWDIGIVKELFEVKDNIIRAAKRQSK